mmetsp:Transcript_89284/g.154638  ORF Transcript_89284/g.154638 Transcript_89284/m.154638 type:complete len:130 (-) Transcript_89284:144-533(-)
MQVALNVIIWVCFGFRWATRQTSKQHNQRLQSIKKFNCLLLVLVVCWSFLFLSWRFNLLCTNSHGESSEGIAVSAFTTSEREFPSADSSQSSSLLSLGCRGKPSSMSCHIVGLSGGKRENICDNLRRSP